MKVEEKILKIKEITSNKGQIEGLPANPRTIKDAKFEALCKSIKDNPEMLNLRELLVTPFEDKYVVIGGNMRLKAMKSIGYKEAPCKIISEATIDQLKAYAIKDNNSFGEWDFDMLITDWDSNQLTEWGIDMPEFEVKPQEKEAYNDDFDEEKDKELITTRVKKGEIWQLGNHYLKCGDATSKEDLDDLMQGKLADLVMTDPPYNVNISSNDGKKIMNDNMSNSAFVDFLTSCFNNIKEHLKDSRSYYIWCLHDLGFEDAMKNVGLSIRQKLIWHKSTFIMGWSDYLRQHELCIYGWKEGKEGHYFRYGTIQTNVLNEPEPDFDKMKADEMRELLKNMYAGLQRDIFIYDKPTKSTDHPTSKPVAMIGKLINNSSKPNEIVLDTFGGSGSTLIACEELDRKCYAMELDPHYCDVILARWEKITGKTATKIK